MVGIFNVVPALQTRHSTDGQNQRNAVRLKPVTFKYNSDWKGRTQYGLIAEEVAEVNPDLVVHGKDGEIKTVRYEQINAMLLNEFLKEHKKVEELAKRPSPSNRKEWRLSRRS